MIPIGTILTPFKEKFGVPRQSLMIPEAKGVIKLRPHPDFQLAVEELDSFSHIWLIFLFDRHEATEWRPLIEPPRTEVQNRVGVFASRSPHRPNPVGLSVVKLDSIDKNRADGIEIHISGVDILNETPLLDMKPYLPYADSIPQASSGWAREEIQKFKVTFSPESLVDLKMARNLPPDFLVLATRMLELDPRPTSQRKQHPIGHNQSENRPYAFRILDFDIKWKIQNGGLYVCRILSLNG